MASWSAPGSHRLDQHEFALGPYRPLCSYCDTLINKVIHCDHKEIEDNLPAIVGNWLTDLEFYPGQLSGERKAEWTHGPCYMCDEMEKVGREGISNYVQISEIQIRFDDWEESTLGRTRWFRLTQGRNFTVNFFLDRTMWSPVYEKATQARFSPSTGSVESLDLAAFWLNDCLKNHEECRLALDPRAYPRLLLDVSETKPRLIKTAETRPSGPYMTLSHCWGAKEFLVLTSKNMDEFMRGIVFDAFPKSFRDAMIVARHLKFQYMWIDSCCIVQDSAFDDAQKLNDIAQMRHVYANSSLNLGIGHAKSPETGCFVPREHIRAQQRKISQHGTVSHRESTLSSQNKLGLQLYSDTDIRGLREELDFQHILERAWVHQERLLSPRMLFFTEKQLFWECLELECSEALPCGNPGPKHNNVKSKFRQKDCSQLQNLWSFIVDQYSAMKLTYPSKDKLVAIGGIAEYLAESTKEEYVAGLWRDHLLLQLCWSIGDTHIAWTGPARAKEWQAPSWSWASLDWRASWGFDLSNSERKYVELAQIQEVRTELVDPNNAYGALKSASMLVTGRLVEVSWRSSSVYDDDGWCTSSDLNQGRFSFLADDKASLYSWCGGERPAYLRSPRPTTLLQASQDAKVYLLPLFFDFPSGELVHLEDIVNGSTSCKQVKVKGLLVQKLPSDAYIRQGAFFVENASWSLPQAIEGVMQPWSTKEEQTIKLI